MFSMRNWQNFRTLKTQTQVTSNDAASPGLRCSSKKGRTRPFRMNEFSKGLVFRLLKSFRMPFLANNFFNDLFMI